MATWSPQPQPAAPFPPQTSPAAAESCDPTLPALPALSFQLAAARAPKVNQPAHPAAQRGFVKIGPWLAAALDKSWESYCAELKRCQAKPTEEAVHELRVATRRLIARLWLLAAVVPSRAPDKARQLLKARLEILGELRDVHVLRLFFNERTGAFPELVLVSDALARLERRLVRSVGRKIARFKLGKLEKWIAGITDELTARSDSPRAQRVLLAAVLRATNRAFHEVVARRQAINPAEPRTIHRTRVAFKRFRYMVESLSPAVTGLGGRPLRTLARYQRKMGNIQDLEVILACLHEYLEDHAHAQPLLEPFCRYLRRRRARALRAFLKSADDLFRFWPPQRMAVPRVTGR